MSTASQPGGTNKKVQRKVQSKKENARIGFLESPGNSGYDNRTDPQYCFDILKKLRKDRKTLDTDHG